MASQSLIQRGEWVRIGSGSSISVLKDPWLSCINDPYVHTDHEALQNTTVSQLMEVDQNRWDMELLNGLFV